MAQNSAALGGDRWDTTVSQMGKKGACERGVAARSCDAAVGSHAHARDRALQSRVLHGEGSPCRARWMY